MSYQIKGPSGDMLHEFVDKTSEKYEFVVYKKGVYHFCFTNKSPYLVTVDFDVHLGHFSYHDQHAKDGKIPFFKFDVGFFQNPIFSTFLS